MTEFLEMPNLGVAEESSDRSRVRAEDLTGIRLRDVRTGRFVAGAGLVTKSFIPGKGWVKATDVGAQGLREAARKRPKHFKDAKTKAKSESAEYREHDDAVREHIADMKKGGRVKPLKSARRAEHAEATWMEGQSMKATQGVKAYAVHAGGRKGERMIVAPKGTDRTTFNHELAHVRPKRSGYRLYKIIKDPKKLMKEEARADMSSGHVGDYHGYKPKLSRRTKSGYTGMARSENQRAMQERASQVRGDPRKMYTKESVNNYRKVQDKIAGARGYDPKTGVPPKGSNTKNMYRKENAARRAAAGVAVVGTGAAIRHDRNVERRIKAESLAKAFNHRGFTEASLGWVSDTAEVFSPEHRKAWRKNKKKVAGLDPRLSVTLRRKSTE